MHFLFLKWLQLEVGFRTEASLSSPLEQDKNVTFRIFSLFVSFSYFLPQFGLPGGRFAHLERLFLHHWLDLCKKRLPAIIMWYCNFSCLNQSSQFDEPNFDIRLLEYHGLIMLIWDKGWRRLIFRYPLKQECKTVHSYFNSDIYASTE